MIIERLMVTYGGTVNVGDYSNVKLEVTLEAALEEGENTLEAYADLAEDAKALYIGEVCVLAERNHTAFNYLRTISPEMAAAVAEHRKAQVAKADKS